MESDDLCPFGLPWEEQEVALAKERQERSPDSRLNSALVLLPIHSIGDFGKQLYGECYDPVRL